MSETKKKCRLLTIKLKKVLRLPILLIALHHLNQYTSLITLREAYENNKKLINWYKLTKF